MAKIVSRTHGAVRKAVGGAKVTTHGERTNRQTIGAVRPAGAAVPVSPDRIGRNMTSPAMKMSQPGGTVGPGPRS